MHPEFQFAERILEFTYGSPAYGFIFSHEKILVEIQEAGIAIPMISAEIQLEPIMPHAFQFGTFKKKPCFIGRIKNNTPPEELLSNIPGTFKFISPRSLGMQIPPEIWQIFSIAIEMDDWDSKSVHCGRCGAKFQVHLNEFGKKCESCGLVEYPRLSPAVIVGIIKNDQILLAHNARFPGAMHSVLAGFVNPGENLEDAVRREIYEEAGIEVKNIQYFGSQPWPFPNSLMLGFTAEYAGGTLRPDGKEIQTLGWFDADHLPTIPPKLSIARKLIDRFLDDQSLDRKSIHSSNSP